MWYEFQWDNSPSKSQYVKSKQLNVKVRPSTRSLAHTKQQAIKGHKWVVQTGLPMILSMKKREIRETRDICKPHQYTTSTVYTYV